MNFKKNRYIFSYADFDLHLNPSINQVGLVFYLKLTDFNPWASAFYAHSFPNIFHPRKYHHSRAWAYQHTSLSAPFNQQVFKKCSFFVHKKNLRLKQVRREQKKKRFQFRQNQMEIIEENLLILKYIHFISSSSLFACLPLHNLKHASIRKRNSWEIIFCFESQLLYGAQGFWY